MIQLQTEAGEGETEAKGAQQARDTSETKAGKSVSFGGGIAKRYAQRRDEVEDTGEDDLKAEQDLVECDVNAGEESAEPGDSGSGAEQSVERVGNVLYAM